MSAAEGPAFPGLRSLSAGAPLSWIAAGWADLCAAPGASLFYGAAFVAIGYLLNVFFASSPHITLALATGFTLIGHATWHAYRALIAPPDESPHAQG